MKSTGEEEKFRILAITPPVPAADEANKIARLLESGAIDCVHIRKPDLTLAEVRKLIEDIPYPLRNRLRLHGHFSLLDEMNLAGVHLNSRCPGAPANAATLSKSCHSIEEVRECPDKDYAYVTLSPIYDSISKQGYRSAFIPADLKEEIAGRRVVALGGVTPERFEELRDAGFYGAALLGYIWEGDFEERLNGILSARKSLELG